MGDKSQDNSSKMFSGPQNSIYSFSDPKLLSQSILIHKLLCESNNLKLNAFQQVCQFASTQQKYWLQIRRGQMQR